MRYTITSPVKFGGKRREPGDPLDLSDEEAAPLLAASVIKPYRKPHADKAAADKAAADKAADDAKAGGQTGAGG